MKTTILAAALVLALAIAALAADMPQVNSVDLQGQMRCLSCDALSCDVKTISTSPSCGSACTAVFETVGGSVYTLAPNDLGKELEGMSMNDQHVEITGQTMPNSQILVVDSYKITGGQASEIPAIPATPDVSDDYYNW